MNALHWVHDPAPPLVGVAAALVSGGHAQLRLVTRDSTACLEEIAEATRAHARWAPYFGDRFVDPCLRLGADA